MIANEWILWPPKGGSGAGRRWIVFEWIAAHHSTVCTSIGCFGTVCGARHVVRQRSSASEAQTRRLIIKLGPRIEISSEKFYYISQHARRRHSPSAPAEGQQRRRMGHRESRRAKPLECMCYSISLFCPFDSLRRSAPRVTTAPPMEHLTSLSPAAARSRRAPQCWPGNKSSLECAT